MCIGMYVCVCVCVCIYKLVLSLCRRQRVILQSWNWSEVNSTTEAPEQRRVATSLSGLWCSQWRRYQPRITPRFLIVDEGDTVMSLTVTERFMWEQSLLWWRVKFYYAWAWGDVQLSKLSKLSKRYLTDISRCELQHGFWKERNSWVLSA